MRPSVVDAVFADTCIRSYRCRGLRAGGNWVWLPCRRWRLVHGGYAVGDGAVVNCPEIHGGHIFLTRVENHVARYPVELLNIGQRVMDTRAVETSFANRIKQSVHGVVSQRCELLGLFLKRS